jgi:hypothetical protein
LKASYSKVCTKSSSNVLYYHYDWFCRPFDLWTAAASSKGLPTQLTLALGIGAAQYIDNDDNKGNGLSFFKMPFTSSSINEDGSRHVASGGDIRVGALILHQRGCPHTSRSFSRRFRVF